MYRLTPLESSLFIIIMLFMVVGAIGVHASYENQQTVKVLREQLAKERAYIRKDQSRLPTAFEPVKKVHTFKIYPIKFPRPWGE